MRTSQVCLGSQPSETLAQNNGCNSGPPMEMEGVGVNLSTNLLYPVLKHWGTDRRVEKENRCFEQFAFMFRKVRFAFVQKRG